MKRGAVVVHSFSVVTIGSSTTSHGSLLVMAVIYVLYAYLVVEDFNVFGVEIARVSVALADPALI